MTSELRALHLRGALGAVRTEMWNGKEHLVVPVVALQEAAIHAVNAKNREFVPASTLIASAGRWNGHPLVVGHPVRDGRQISAHSDAVLAQHGFGFIRQAMMNGKRLGMEAMVDPARLEALGHSQLLADLRAGKPVEVSVGAYVQTNDKTGSFDGRDWNGEWTDITPDHLAFLPGGTGACSISMGCGSGRIASSYLVTAEGFEEPVIISLDGKKIAEAVLPHIPTQIKGASMKIRSLKERILAIFDTPEEAASEEQAELVAYQTLKTMAESCDASCSQIMDTIDELIADETESPTENDAQEKAETEVETARLESIASLCMSMMASCSAMMTVVNQQLTPDAAMPSDPRYMEAFRAAIGKRNNATDAAMIQTMHDHAAALGATCDVQNLRAMSVVIDGKKIAQVVLPLIPSAITKEEREVRRLAMKKMQDCPACEGLGQLDNKDCPLCDGSGTVPLKAAASAEGDSTMTPETRTAALKALSTCGCSTVPTTDDQIVEAFTTLAEAHSAKDAEATKAKAEADAKIKTLEAAQIPAEELVKMRTLMSERDTQDAKEKTDLVGKLKALGTLTEEQLNAKPLTDLRTLAAFAKVETPDYSGRGVAVPRAAAVVEDYTPPRPYDASIKALQSAKR